jgi:P27 family predicted phage terminase small subunit
MPGARGRPPRPIAQVKLQGDYRPYRHDKRAIEPTAPGELKDCQPPQWMSESQRALWHDILERAPLGLLAAIDLELFAAYVEVVDCYNAAVKTQNELRLFDAQCAVSPYRKVIKDCLLLMVRLQSEMGFTPAARARLGQPAEPPPLGKEADPWALLRHLPVNNGKAA